MVRGTDKASLCSDDLNKYQALIDLQVKYKEKCVIYRAAERKWRSRSFHVAVLLGTLPVLAGVTVLMPEAFRPWLTLCIAILNVFVVVLNVKLDMGERIADASMAGKGFDKVDTQIDLFFCELKCGEKADASELLIRVRAVVDNIEANISYPEVQDGNDFLSPPSAVALLDTASTMLQRRHSKGSVNSGTSNFCNADMETADRMEQGRSQEDAKQYPSIPGSTSSTAVQSVGSQNLWSATSSGQWKPVSQESTQECRPPFPASTTLPSATPPPPPPPPLAPAGLVYKSDGCQVENSPSNPRVGGA